jgi:hypothetical protein
LLGYRADLYHVFVTADIEGLIVDDIAGRFEQGDKRPGDVFNMDQRSPWAAVGLQPYAALRKGRARQVVHHYVGPQPRRGSVRGCVAQVGRTEVLICQFREALLGHHLAFAVRRDGVEAARLVDGLIASCAI